MGIDVSEDTTNKTARRRKPELVTMTFRLLHLKAVFDHIGPTIRGSTVII